MSSYFFIAAEPDHWFNIRKCCIRGSFSHIRWWGRKCDTGYRVIFFLKFLSWGVILPYAFGMDVKNWKTCSSKVIRVWIYRTEVRVTLYLNFNSTARPSRIHQILRQSLRMHGISSFQFNSTINFYNMIYWHSSSFINSALKYMALCC